MSDGLVLFFCGAASWVLVGLVTTGALFHDEDDLDLDSHEGLPVGTTLFWPLFWAAYVAVVFYRLGRAIGRKLS